MKERMNLVMSAMKNRPTSVESPSVEDSQMEDGDTSRIKMHLEHIKEHIQFIEQYLDMEDSDDEQENEENRMENGNAVNE